MTPTRTAPDETALSTIRQEIAGADRFLLTSHQSPDGDSIGSQVAMAFALRALGKTVRLVNRDLAPDVYLGLPGVSDIEIADRVDGTFDLVLVMECPDLSRPGVVGLDRFRILNMDHHEGNTLYGAVNWYDPSAAACGELVADVIDVLGVAWSPAIATHLYVAILTDTGSFRHGNITARTFECCRRAVEAGVDAAGLARLILDSGSAGKLRLIGAMLDAMVLEADGRVALLHLDDDLLAATGATRDDTEGLVNLPLSAREVQAVALFRCERSSPGCRVSLRSKGSIDVRSIATTHGGGGHRNAAGFTLSGPLAEGRLLVADALARAVEDDERRVTDPAPSEP